MSGLAYFKFKSALTYDSVAFDGVFITVAELKRCIKEKKGLKDELALINAHTNEGTSRLRVCSPFARVLHPKSCVPWLRVAIGVWTHCVDRVQGCFVSRVAHHPGTPCQRRGPWLRVLSSGSLITSAPPPGEVESRTGRMFRADSPTPQTRGRHRTDGRSRSTIQEAPLSTGKRMLGASRHRIGPIKPIPKRTLHSPAPPAADQACDD